MKQNESKKELNKEITAKKDLKKDNMYIFYLPSS
jgi:hypothetical protein